MPEIVVQTDNALNVWKGTARLPRVAQDLDRSWHGNSAPVIGDVDGDTLPDIAITKQVAGSAENGEVRLYNRNGVLHPRFPKPLMIGKGGVPAIADMTRSPQRACRPREHLGRRLGAVRQGVGVRPPRCDLRADRVGPVRWRRPAPQQLRGANSTSATAASTATSATSATATSTSTSTTASSTTTATTSATTSATASPTSATTSATAPPPPPPPPPPAPPPSARCRVPRVVGLRLDHLQTEGPASGVPRGQDTQAALQQQVSHVVDFSRPQQAPSGEQLPGRASSSHPEVEDKAHTYIQHKPRC